MNWLLIVVLVFIGYHVFDGYRRGFIRKAVSALSLILTLVLVTYLTPYITNFLQEKTSMHENLQKRCTEMFLDVSFDSGVKTDQVQMIENMDLPKNIKEMLIENNNSEAYDLLAVTGFDEYIGAYLANMIINAFAYLLTFVIVWTGLRLILMAMDIVTKLPVLHGLNKIAGGGLGFVFSVVLIWIAFLIVTILCNGNLGKQFFALISQSPFLLFLYNQNVVMKIVFGLMF